MMKNPSCALVRAGNEDMSMLTSAYMLAYLIGASLVRSLLFYGPSPFFHTARKIRELPPRAHARTGLGAYDERVKVSFSLLYRSLPLSCAVPAPPLVSSRQFPLENTARVASLLSYIVLYFCTFLTYFMLFFLKYYGIVHPIILSCIVLHYIPLYHVML